MPALNLVVIHGTTRKGNKSHFVSRYIEKLATSSSNWAVTYVDPAELELPGDGNDEWAKDPRYTKITEEADAFFIITPEYNHSFPGSLKRVLDSELANYIHKPVSVAGVSAGRYGGARAVVALAPVLREIGMVMSFTDVLVGDSYNAFNEETGEPNDAYVTTAINDALVELEWLAHTLKYGRDELQSKHHESPAG